MLWGLIVVSLIVISVMTIVNISGRNAIILLLAIELLFFALSIGCIALFYGKTGAHWNFDMLFLALAITVLAAAESAVGLALIARIHRRTKSIKIRKI